MLWPWKKAPWLDYTFNFLDPSFLQLISLAWVWVDLIISELYLHGSLFSVIRKIYLEEKIPSFYQKFKTYLSLALTYRCFRRNSCTLSISVFFSSNYWKSTLQIPYIRFEVQCILMLIELSSGMWCEIWCMTTKVSEKYVAFYLQNLGLPEYPASYLIFLTNLIFQTILSCFDTDTDGTMAVGFYFDGHKTFSLHK
jgi:hypothetical protein